MNSLQNVYENNLKLYENVLKSADYYNNRNMHRVAEYEYHLASKLEKYNKATKKKLLF